MGAPRLPLARSGAELASAALAILVCLGLGLGFLVLGAILDPFTGGGMLVPAVTAAGCVLVAGSAAQPGFVEVRLDELVIRRPGGLSKPLRIPRERVTRVHVDDGTSADAARFATGDRDRPFLWPTGAKGWRRHQQQVTPNVAVVLDQPLALAGPRGDAAVTVHGDPALPFQPISARVVFLAVLDPNAAAAAPATWPLERPGAVPVLSPQLRGPRGTAPRGFVAAAVGSSVVVAFLGAADLGWPQPAPTRSPRPRCGPTGVTPSPCLPILRAADPRLRRERGRRDRTVAARAR